MLMQNNISLSVEEYDALFGVFNYKENLPLPSISLFIMLKFLAANKITYEEAFDPEDEHIQSTIYCLKQQGLVVCNETVHGNLLPTLPKSPSILDTDVLSQTLH